MEFRQPLQRDEFEIAIICSLPREFDAICLLLDESWDENGDQYGRAVGDPNHYSTGRIGKHPVVLTLLSSRGKANAASASVNMRSSYPGLRLVLLVGICGGVPSPLESDEIFLGDVIISKNIIQYDFGTQYPHSFIREDYPTNKPSEDARNLLITLETDHWRDWLLKQAKIFMEDLYSNAMLRGRGSKYEHPGPAHDMLFESTYPHKHQKSPGRLCSTCLENPDWACEKALGTPCDVLKCNEQYLIKRKHSEMQQSTVGELGFKAHNFSIHMGAIASGDQEMRSGQHRDMIAKKENVIAFETEGAGVWEEFPCIIIKGVCNYADTHMNEDWQNYAAATAASTMKALLLRYTQTDKKPLEYAYFYSNPSSAIEPSADLTKAHQHTPIHIPNKTLTQFSHGDAKENHLFREGSSPNFGCPREQKFALAP